MITRLLVSKEECGSRRTLLTALLVIALSPFSDRLLSVSSIFSLLFFRLSCIVRAFYND